MKTIFDHIDHIRKQPHHIRRGVAFSSAAVGTGIIALVWFVSSWTTGAFALRDSSFDAPTPVITTDTNAGTSGLAGAAAALPDENIVPAHIEIIDAPSASSAKKQAEQTILPF